MVAMRKIEAVLTALNDGDSQGLRGRLGYLNLQNFPPGLRVGRSKRADYELDDVLAFALWFALTRASFTPLSAVAFVADLWPEFVRLFLAAAEKAGMTGIKVPDRDETVAVITRSALPASSKTKEPMDDMRAPAQAFDLQISNRAQIASKLGTGLAPSIVIDFEAVRTVLLTAMSMEPLPVTGEALSAQTREIATREGWTGSDLGIKRPIQRVRPKTVPARGERLGEADYYFSRAISLIDDVVGASELPLRTLRAQRLGTYLLNPSPREAWKQWVAVGESEIPFVWGIIALVEEAVGIDTGVPETVLVGARSALGENGGLGELADKLRDTAVSARGYEPIESE